MKSLSLTCLFVIVFSLTTKAQEILLHLHTGDSIYGMIKTFRPPGPCGYNSLDELIGSTCNLTMVALVVVDKNNVEHKISFGKVKDFWVEGQQFAVFSAGGFGESKAYRIVVDGKMRLYSWDMNVVFKHKKYDRSASLNSSSDVYVKTENKVHLGNMLVFLVPNIRSVCNAGYFKNHYAEIMKDCPAVIEKINKGEIGKEDLVAAFTYYNENCGK